MSVGLYDLDMALYRRVPFNLEIMKLATYYKKQNEIVVLAPDFTPEKYTKFIVRKDYDDGNYPTNLGLVPNVEYGGHAFTGNYYAPLDIKIEETFPDLIVYNRIKGNFLERQIDEAVFKRMNKSTHLRLSLDGETIWGNYEKQIKSVDKKYIVLLHDYNLNKIENSFEVVKDLLKQHSRQGYAAVGVKFPIQVSNETDLLKWTSLPAAIDLFALEYNGFINDSVYKELVDKIGFQYAKSIHYVVTKNCSEKELIEKFLPKIYRQIMYSRSKRRLISLKYDKYYFTDERWERVINLINRFNENVLLFSRKRFEQKIKYDSMYSYAHSRQESSRYNHDIITKDEVRELFQFVRKENYELFKSFYECSIPIFKGGAFQDGRISN